MALAYSLESGRADHVEESDACAMQLMIVKIKVINTCRTSCLTAIIYLKTKRHIGALSHSLGNLFNKVHTCHAKRRGRRLKIYENGIPSASENGILLIPFC